MGTSLVQDDLFKSPMNPSTKGQHSVEGVTVQQSNKVYSGVHTSGVDIATA